MINLKIEEKKMKSLDFEKGHYAPKTFSLTCVLIKTISIR